MTLAIENRCQTKANVLANSIVGVLVKYCTFSLGVVGDGFVHSIGRFALRSNGIPDEVIGDRSILTEKRDTIIGTSLFFRQSAN